MNNITVHSSGPMAQGWNSSATIDELAALTMNRNFALLIVSLISAIIWIVYINYYNSRVLGYILTRLINKFYFQDENFKIGSFTLNALSGKIMFRNIVYINYDYTVRIQDGYLIFRWWRNYIPKDVSEDLSHSDTRLSIMLNGFELHFYNRCDLYNELEKTFGLDPVIKQNHDDGSADREKAMNDANEKKRRAQEAVRSEAAMARTWRDLIPVIKIDVCTGRVVFGNRLVPTTLSISIEEAHLMYSTKPPASSLDHLMHFVKAKAENCKVILAPSPNYTAMVDEPPRYMGEGFVVMSSNYIEVYFYMDEPGLVPEHPVLLQLANGDVVESAPPIWGVDIKCGKGTDFSYGPWADRQRDHLFKFFFPPDYKSLEVTPQPKPGDRRQMQSFDIRLSTLNEATIDILFTKNKETNAVHINIGAGSYLEVTLPWIVLQDGYTTKITGQLLHLEATTSLQYRSLAESETLEYNVKCHYPLVWNHHQSWLLSLTGCKATANLVYTHIDFFLDLVNDWASKARPDILTFVPYTWKISLLLKECEVVTVSNEHNWIDCSSTNQENNHVAFCGDLLDVSFDLPFVDFLPDVIPLKIWIQGEAVDMSLYLPEVNTSRLLLLSIDKNMKLVPCRLKSPKWRRRCVKSQGWIDCWSVPIVALSVRYNYHPIPPSGPEPQADITTPEKEEILLSPMRIQRTRKQPQLSWAMDGNKFDRTTLPPDKVSVELEVGPSILFAYGTIITSFMNLLENFFGDNQTFTDMQKNPTKVPTEQSSKYTDRGSLGQSEICIDDSTDSKAPFDPRKYRPLDVTVSIIIHDIQAHLVKNCSESEPPCPVVLIERFGFEMDKSFKETKLQLLLSPSILLSCNNLSRTNPHNSSSLYQGHLMLSSFQLRGHGFFSDTNRSVEDDTIEYAWMMELQLGQLTGRLTLPQLYQVISSLETFLMLILDNENELLPPNPVKQCHHGVNTVTCPETDLNLKYRCPTSNEIKYKMIRVAVDLIDIYLADTNTTLQTWISPVRLSFCNLHGPGFDSGLTALLPNIKLALYTQTNMQSNLNHNSTGSATSHAKIPECENWVGVGSTTLGPVLIEIADSLPQSPKSLQLVQQKFLKLHDDQTKRLWFLWPNDGKSGLCGCTGGCSFFGSNKNGSYFFKPNPSDLQDGVNVALFNVIDIVGEYGYGQSLLHPGQLVFHTPPYNTLNVCLQPTVSLIPSPLPQISKSPQGFERRTLTRRFSYTSINKGSNNMVSSTKSDVPYARLVEATAPLGSSKIDSDSKLNKAVLSVPQMESSVSDSKLALNCAARDQASKKSRQRVDDAFVVPKVPVRSVAVSDSHFSLNSQHQEDTSRADIVQRTTSITSENPSEAFFSADEDFPSRTSSLKNSFGSRQSYHKDKSSFGLTDLPTEKWSNSLPKSAPAEGLDTMSNLSVGVQPDSESGSVSSTSFISAISSQEDMTLVNLHMQTDKLIVDSPLLMSSYMQNLPQYKCSNWSSCSLPVGSDAFTLPLFKRADDGTLIYVGQKYLPKFEPLGKVNMFKLITKKEGHNGQNQQGPYSNLTPNFNSQIKSHPYPTIWWELQDQNNQDSQENTNDKSTGSTVSTTSDIKTGICIKLRGDIDVMLTPLVLESTQKFLESLGPVFANVHPITVISHLQFQCIQSVQKTNILKQKNFVNNWLPLMEERNQATNIGKDDKYKTAVIPQTHIYEETITEQLQATLHIPKINVVLMQSSVVEDMISFAALDNIQDLTCVSLFGISIENITGKFVNSRKSVETIQMYYRPTLRALGSKKTFGIMKGPRALISAHTSGRKRGPEKGEPVFIETPQQQWNDTTFSLGIGKAHGQLRRLRNESSQLKDVTITGIPAHDSKVSFSFIKTEAGSGRDSVNHSGPNGDSQSEALIGHIMFECGLEGVTLKAAKHSQMQKHDDEEKTAKGDAESCRESVKSAEEVKPEKAKSRTSGLEELFRKRDSSSKPSTPNLSSQPPPPPQPPPQVPPPEPSTPGPEQESSNNSSGVTIVPVKQNDNTTACSIDLKCVCFNFAAPPHTPITKKIDYTRLDWNLVSTGGPAISAWLKAWARMGARWGSARGERDRRGAATAAALMASALDRPPTPAITKSRYGRHTCMSQSLRSEPSLQLCAALLRCALQGDGAALQCDLAERHLPTLSTLRQGVIVLCRQWKNILYTPLLLEHNFKSKLMKPLNVTFALPDLLEDSVEGWQEYQVEAETLDENCLLLDMDDKANLPGRGRSSPRPHSFPSTTPPHSVRGTQGRGSLAFPSLPFTRKQQPEDGVGILSDYGLLKEDQTAVGSNPSLYSAPENEDVNRAREDLYQWMAKQEPIKVEAKSKKIPPTTVPTGGGETTACSLYPLQGSLMLLDAHLVFQPLLAALRVTPSALPPAGQPARSGTEENGLEALGSRVSLELWLDSCRVDIAVSRPPQDRHRRGGAEWQAQAQAESAAGAGAAGGAGGAGGAAALQCSRVSVSVSLGRVADVCVEQLVRRRDVLYVARDQLDRHVTTRLHYTASVRYISHQVNMPLLRLLHQITEVYRSVKETQLELRSQSKRARGQGKHDSESVSDFQENLVSVSSLDKEGCVGVAPSEPPSEPPSAPASLLEPLGERADLHAIPLTLRFTGNAGKQGYSSLSEAPTPLLPPGASIQLAPRCWSTLYQLLQLYAAVPDQHTITHRFSVPTEYRTSRGRRSAPAGGIVVRGTARIHRTRLLARLSGLQLEASLTSLLSTVSGGRRGVSAGGHLARAAVLLLEGPAPQQQTVVRVTIGKSQGAVWTTSAAGSVGGVGSAGAVGSTGGVGSAGAAGSTGGVGSVGSAGMSLGVGAVRAELPQHPGALHAAMARSTRHLSTTLAELGVGRTGARRPPPPPPPPGETPPAPPPPPHVPAPTHTPHVPTQIHVCVQSVSVTAALLPSLQAQYKMESVSGGGVLGPRAHFDLLIPQHSLSFSTKLQSESNIPAAAAVPLPAVGVRARSMEGGGGGGAQPEGLVLRAGRYLSATADIGLFEHQLSTTLLNHLVTVQKVFMKEVNEVVQKVYGGEKPVPLWNEDDSTPSSNRNRLLFSLTIRIKRIQLTATTPSNSGVRLETGAVELQLSNRVQNVPRNNDTRLFAKLQVDINLSLGQLIRNPMFEEAEPEFQQYAFFNTRITMRNAFEDECIAGDDKGDKEVVLITLRRPLIYVQPVAVDRAILVWLNYKNAYDYWNEKRMDLHKDVIAATQQLFEKVQLTSQLAAQQISTLFLQLNVDDIGICLPLNQPPTMGLRGGWGGGMGGMGGGGGGGGGGTLEGEGRGCVVVTLDSTCISACSSQALVSKGRFVGLCLRFAEDFDPSLDEWKPEPDHLENVCSVSEGTYEVCSRTAAPRNNANAQWFLNVSWQMEGVDIHLDVSVGKQLSALGHTLTMLTGFEEDDPVRNEYESDIDDEADISRDSQESIVFRRKFTDHLPAFVFDPTIDAKKRSKLIEKEMTEQAKIINDLRSLGASHSTIEYEMKRLHDLEALVFKDFRRDMIQKLRRQSVRASSITKGKLGLGSNRSHSFIASSPPPEPPDLLDNGESVSLLNDSGENLLLDEDPRLADIIEGASWTSLESGPSSPGPSRSLSCRSSGRPPGMQRQTSLPEGSHSYLPNTPHSAPPLETQHSGEGKTQSKVKQAEPNIDFELDIKVHINSGKCVLHTREQAAQDDIKMRGLRSGGTSPVSRRKRHAPPPGRTEFRVPALDTKVHYESKTISEEVSTPVTSQGWSSRKVGSKKAALFAWITVQSIPEETVISPHILDFLEQALDPIPTKTFVTPATESGEGPGLEAQALPVYASFPVDVVVHFHMLASTFRFSCVPASRVECLMRLPTLTILASSQPQRPNEEESTRVAMGGLSITGCLADFSIYIFHPYCGVKRGANAGSPLADTQRKDSLSINVEFVKFHLSRSRRLDVRVADRSKHTVRFSTIVDVGSASFKYDMRRLSEILSFPKAWYRRTIVRRMFLGDTNADTRHNAQQYPPSPVPQREKTRTIEHHKSKDLLTVAPPSDVAWETLVLFAVNFTRLNIQMNMGNVMGNVSWQSGELRSTGRLNIGSSGHRNVLGTVALGRSALDARQGIVGGHIDLARLYTHVHIEEEAGRPPAHSIGVRLAALELKLEYMGGLVLLARVSSLAAGIRDRWQPTPTRPTIILAHGKLGWQQLQILMSRSTTPDLMKMQLKLEEFFTHQFKSSKRVFSSLRPDYNAHSNRGKRDAPSAEGQQHQELKHHRHWQNVLQFVSGMQLSNLRTRLSADGCVLGGTMELQGCHVSLACFHGNSFKAKSWALFSLKEPAISFATEAQQRHNSEGSVDVQVVQSLLASLGGAGGAGGPGGSRGEAPPHQSMGTVCRMTRTLLFPPQLKTLREWFHYAFANSEIDAIEQFPSLERETSQPTTAASRNAADKHNREVIFALPPLQLHLRTQHVQGPTAPTLNDEKPVVECSFITEFEDHIFVSVDAEAFLFLHDLISSYIKEKERVMSGGRPSWGEPGAPPAASDKEGATRESLTQDYRDYRCVTWHLEPTVRLLSWGGKSIEPYGVDYILQKLGFSHARTTIPKWLQRGTLDPLDKVLSIALLKLVGIVPHSKT